MLMQRRTVLIESVEKGKGKSWGDFYRQWSSSHGQMCISGSCLPSSFLSYTLLSKELSSWNSLITGGSFWEVLLAVRVMKDVKGHLYECTTPQA